MFKGSFPALITPFANGALDEKALRDLVDWQISEGTHGLVTVGTTGESPTLTHEEHEQVIAITVEQAKGRVPVIAGAGSNNTVESIRFAHHAERVGADAILVVSPYYNKPNQRGLYAHFKAVAGAVELPLFIYNIPGRSIVDVKPDTMGELAKIDNIVGVKDATGDVCRVSDQRITCGPDFIQLSGEDGSALGFNAHGGVGCISVTANVAPRLCAEFQEATLAGDYAKALIIQDRLMPLHRAMFADTNPAPAKYGLSLLGRCAEDVRSPMMPLEDDVKEKVRAAMVHAGLLN
ncbi:4-hydroxy-tetrahydrodipicolinate synthase [Paracoccaceae bacterium GXU_MW_L88]